MSSASDYTCIRPEHSERVNDRPRNENIPSLSGELALQARWFAGEFGRDFTSTDGSCIRIVQFGVWNHEAGPDFSDAAIAVDGGTPKRGCIELDSHSRNWETHGHATNPSFDSVVLHVVASADGTPSFSRTSQHRNIAQIVLGDITLDGDPPSAALPAAKPGRCCAPLRNASPETVLDIVRAAAQFRLERKAARLAKLADAHGDDEALYQSLAAALGYKHNQLPFTLLAQRISLRHLGEASTTLEAELFGSAGFLNMPDLGKVGDDTRGYLRGLWDEWWRLRSEREALLMSADLWTLGGNRPINHPQRRVAALAVIAKRWRNLRKATDSETVDPKGVTSFFRSLTHDYWQHHYTLTSKAAPRPMALVGDTRIAEIQANVILPWLCARGHDVGATFTSLPARLTNRTLETAAIRLFGSAESDHAKAVLRTVAGQQGLLQIYKDFCLIDASDCQDCQFPERVTGWKRPYG